METLIWMPTSERTALNQLGDCRRHTVNFAFINRGMNQAQQDV